MFFLAYDVMDFRYPKDAEKHLLAVKSGLTRSQVLVTLLLDTSFDPCQVVV